VQFAYAILHFELRRVSQVPTQLMLDPAAHISLVFKDQFNS